jgi:hypothetical protein
MFLLSEPENFGDASPCQAQILNLKRFESGALDRSVAIVENARPRPLQCEWALGCSKILNRFMPTSIGLGGRKSNETAASEN